MRAPKVEIAGGDGFDLLVSAVAVADPDWRDVLAHGAAVWSTVRHDAGAECGPSGGPVRSLRMDQPHRAPRRAPRTGGRDDLVALVDGTPADELRFVVAGGRREQMRERLGAERLRDALAADATAAASSSRALAAPGMLLDVTTWVRRTSDDELKATLQRLLDGWPDLPVSGDPASARHARAAAPRDRSGARSSPR